MGQVVDHPSHYSQGTVLTVGLFLGLIAFKFALGTDAYLTHVSYSSSMGEILLMIGLMVGVQAEIIWRRAQAMGAITTLAQMMING